MFEIKTTTNEVGDGGSLAISWCIDDETIKYLKANEITDPQIVIVVAPQGRLYHPNKEIRYIVPLRDLMAYITFKTAGPNKIYAFISTGSRTANKSTYLSLNSCNYDTTILESDGSDYRPRFKSASSSEPLSVLVPTGCFAPEPKAWEKAWVNHFFNSKPTDQCNFRRRRIFAYSIQPIMVLGLLIWRSFFLLIALMIGARNISMQPLLHPLSTSNYDAVKVCTSGTFFVRHLPEDDDINWKFGAKFWPSVSYLIRSFWCLPLMPVVLLPLVLIIYLHKVLFFMFVLSAVIFVVFLAFVLESGLVGNFLEKWYNKLTSTDDKEIWYDNQQEIDYLSCSKQNGPLTFNKLPSKKKTIRLRFKDLKSRVCKPFSA